MKTTINRERYFWRWNTDFKYQTNVRAYYRMVSGIDQAIGRFLKALDEAGLSENTIIVYSADNGYYMGNRGLAGKWSHFEESLRVPLIVMDPRVADGEKGKVSEDIALNLGPTCHFPGLGRGRRTRSLPGAQSSTHCRRRQPFGLAYRVLSRALRRAEQDPSLRRAAQ